VPYLAELWEVVVSLPEKTDRDGAKVFAFYNSEENVEKRKLVGSSGRTSIEPYFPTSKSYHSIITTSLIS